MNPDPSFDTIAAMATPHGRGGISVIRVSGPHAWKAVRAIFKSAYGATDLKPNRVRHGAIMDKGEPIDDVLIACFKNPRSYTGEDSVEISCHGNPLIAHRILNLLGRQNVRMAEPGEFTQRAFLNGKLDLAQAEAIADLIHAKTEASRRVAIYQLKGRLSNRLKAIREELINACSLLEIELDFSEEDIEFANRSELSDLLNRINREFTSLLQTFQKGRIAREGIRLVITGPPNVGKSSILNHLLERERAIVTDIPGTTRDTIEEEFDLDDWLFHVTDTAGMRETEDLVEKEGVRRTEEAIRGADIIITVLDGSTPLSDEDEALLHANTEQRIPNIVLLNKSDLPARMQPFDLPDTKSMIRLSAKTGEGFDKLHSALKTLATADALPHEGDIILTRARHAQAIESATRHVKAALLSLTEGMSQEFITLDIRGALNDIGEITGQTSTDEILNHIFSEFCIGK